MDSLPCGNGVGKTGPMKNPCGGGHRGWCGDGGTAGTSCHSEGRRALVAKHLEVPFFLDLVDYGHDLMTQHERHLLRPRR